MTPIISAPAAAMHTVSPAAIRVTMRGADFGKKLVPISTKPIWRPPVPPRPPAPGSAPGTAAPPPAPATSYLPSLQTILPQAPTTSYLPSTLLPGSNTISVTVPAAAVMPPSGPAPSQAAATVRDALTAAKSLSPLAWLGIALAIGVAASRGSRRS